MSIMRSSGDQAGGRRWLALAAAAAMDGGPRGVRFGRGQRQGRIVERESGGTERTPVQAFIVPLYVLIYKLHLYDTLFALVLTMSAAAIPVSVLIMVNFVRDIPRELISAMLIDGGTEWTVFRRLIWPLSRPVLATLSIYNGLNVWNNFLLPLVLTRSNSVAVLPLGLTKLEGLYVINVPAVMAAVLLSVLPLVALFVIMRKQVMRSLGSIVMR